MAEKPFPPPNYKGGSIVKFNFVVFMRNNSRLLQFVEYLHCNHHRFTVHPFNSLVVVFIYEGDGKVLEEALRVGVVLIIPQQEVK
jgi:hypothetical protein